MSEVLKFFKLGTGKQAALLAAEDVYVKETKKPLLEYIRELGNTQDQALADLKAKYEAHEAAWNKFLNDDDADTEVWDTMAELVHAIQANKTSIDGILEQESRMVEVESKKHEHANKDILDGISKTSDNKLQYGGEILGNTGIAIMTSFADEANYTGKIEIVLEDVPVN